jgi:hypothetical protein
LRDINPSGACVLQLNLEDKFGSLSSEEKSEAFPPRLAARFKMKWEIFLEILKTSFTQVLLAYLGGLGSCTVECLAGDGGTGEEKGAAAQNLLFINSQ